MTTSTPINYETISPKTFYLTAYVSDGQASASGTLTIDVSDVNEAPSFSKSYYSITGNEGAVSISQTPPERHLPTTCLRGLNSSDLPDYLFLGWRHSRDSSLRFHGPRGRHNDVLHRLSTVHSEPDHRRPEFDQ